jgi:outer membrane protein assembly factor BamB
MPAKVVAPAAIDGERVLAGAMDGTLVSLARSDGKVIWHRKLPAAIASAPVVAQSLDYVGSRDYLLHAFDAATGAEPWRQHYWASWVESTPRVVDGVIYIGSSDLRVVRAYEASSGQPLWTTDVHGSVWGSPWVTRDAVYAGAIGAKDYPIEHHPSIVALDRKTGAVRWRRAETAPPDAELPGHAGGVVVVGDLLIAGGTDGTLVALPLP